MTTNNNFLEKVLNESVIKIEKRLIQIGNGFYVNIPKIIDPPEKYTLYILKNKVIILVPSYEEGDKNE